MNTLANSSLYDPPETLGLEQGDQSMHDQIVSSSPVTVDAAPSSIAQWLRGLGVLAVATSAIVFLLQGFNNIDLEFRNWVYLALMAVMGSCGIASQKFLQDAKGSRLFFSLAVLLVPVQFSQLAGLVHDIASIEGAVVSNLLWLVAATGLIAVPLAYAGMAILARNDKRLLTGALLMMCSVLLIPERNTLLGFATLAGLSAGVMWLELKLFRLSSVYSSLEGVGVRLLLAVPLVIASVRMSMHIDGLAGAAAMCGILGVFLSRLQIGKEWLQSVAAILGVVGWWLYASETMPVILDSEFGFCCLMLPSSIWLLDMARLSKHNAVRYRIAACLLWATAAGSLLVVAQVGSGINFTLAALLLGVLALVWGVFGNLRQPTLTGIVISTLSLILLVAQSLNSLEVNSWIGLGVVGITLVFSASLVEKFGRPLLTGGQKAWVSISSWD